MTITLGTRLITECEMRTRTGRRVSVMRAIRRMGATAALSVAVMCGGAVAADATALAEGEVACGYDYDDCVTQWYDYGFVKNYIVSEIYYSGGGYHFYWWN